MKLAATLFLSFSFAVSAFGVSSDPAFTKKAAVVKPSTFHKDADGTITRIAHDHFGPGDLYNPVWHMFPLLDGGVDGWQPKFRYGG